MKVASRCPRSQIVWCTSTGISTATSRNADTTTRGQPESRITAAAQQPTIT
jgi:hypothetical protein